MIAIRHIDEARQVILDYLQGATDVFEKAVLIEDIFGKMRLVLWAKTGENIETVAVQVKQGLEQVSGPFWTGEIWLAPGKSHADQALYDQIWQESDKLQPNLGVDNRYRSRSAWFRAPIAPPWEEDEKQDDLATPIMAFYSFKGGFGRTTALAAFAIQRARLGERVAVIDLDLDAPGLGTLFAPADDVAPAQYGVADYFLEQPLLGNEPDLSDYYHLCARPKVIGDKGGGIYVFPAGKSDSLYLSKLARIDLDPPQGDEQPLQNLLHRIRAEIAPHWILLDLRAGLAEASALGLSGFAHLHVLFGNYSEQSWLGLKMVLERLGRERILTSNNDEASQADCLLVHSMVADNPQVSRLAEPDFDHYAREVFSEVYYVEADHPLADSLWSVNELGDTQDAPHVPIVVHYTDALTYYKSIDEVADRLAGENPDYRRLGERITQRFIWEE